MQHGTVKWFSKGKGYGFLAGDDGKDVFVHHSNILMEGYKYLEAGERVCYQIEPTEKGDKAVNIFRNNG